MHNLHTFFSLQDNNQKLFYLPTGINYENQIESNEKINEKVLFS